jgi:hypothetical protein
VPLIHQVDRWRNYECGDTSIRDRLDTEERFPTPSREHDAAATIIGSPRIERGLLVLSRFDLEGGIERKSGIRPSRIFDRNSGRLDGFLLG